VFGRSARKDTLKKKIYNADETGLFYNMTPDTSFKFKGEWQETKKPFNSVYMCKYKWNGQKKTFCNRTISKSLDVSRM
jgi:hypothetical protein